MLHVLIGQNSFKSTFEDCVRRGLPANWIVPKAAQPGDAALIVFHRDQFVGTGVIAEEPASGTFGNQPAFSALVRDLAEFKRPLSVAKVADRIPEWKWTASYTKGRTTPTVEIARKLDRIVADHVARVGLKPSPRAAGSTSKGSKTKGAAPPKERQNSEPKEVKLSGPQLDAVIHEQTNGARLGAEGRKYLRTHVVTERKASNRKFILELRSQQGPITCDACGIDLAKRYGPEHREVLELHHRIPLRRGAQRPAGTEVFALLCPTCHRVVHYRREDPLDVEVLRARLWP
jgi:hypothetical protein